MSLPPKKKKKKNTAYEALANTYASSLWVWKLHCGKLHGSQRVVHPTVFDKLLLGGELFHKHYIGQYQAALAEYGNIVT